MPPFLKQREKNPPSDIFIHSVLKELELSAMQKIPEGNKLLFQAVFRLSSFS